MSEWHYQYAGLIITSALELPEWAAYSCFDAPSSPDVTIHAHCTTVPFNCETPQLISADEYNLLLPRIGHYRVINGNRIEIAYLDGADVRKLRFFLMGSVWGALCYQRGMLAIHAGAVMLEDKAILLCANQGKGKSTLTACLTLRGHPLISDDLCCLEIQDHSPPIVHPSIQRLRLWGDALQQLGIDKNVLERDFFRMDKYLIPWKGNNQSEPVPLQAIYLLEWGETGLERLSGKQALQGFIAAATYRYELLHQMGKDGVYLQSCLKLLAKTPVWVLTRPRNLSDLHRTVELLESHYRTST